MAKKQEFTLEMGYQMMEDATKPKRYVIADKFFPANPFRLLHVQALQWIVLDRIGIAQWGWGVWWTLAVFAMSVNIYFACIQKEREPVFK